MLLICPSSDGLDGVLRVIQRAGIAARHEIATSRTEVLAALQREEWDLVVYDPAMRKHSPIELVYTHAPASAIAIFHDHAELADELARLVAARIELNE